MPGPLDATRAMNRAVALAGLSPAHGPNPRVGAVLTDAEGRLLGEGFHRGAGTPHAEVVAIADAASRGESTQGSIAYVTLEPCDHTGRTGPCTRALAGAGVSKVVYAVADPNPAARGGAATLERLGISAVMQDHEGARELNHRWLRAMGQGRPYVIAKWAQTLDGFTAAADGTSFWITSEAARDHAHRVRTQVDAIIVGTGTVLTDDPQLSARPGGVLADQQPLRVVLGRRPTPGAQVWRDDHSLALEHRDPHAALATLWQREVRSVIVEGGATVVTAFLTAGLVDEVNVYVAPALLGQGTRAVGDLGIGTMADVLRGEHVEALPLGIDTLISARVGKD